MAEFEYMNNNYVKRMFSSCGKTQEIHVNKFAFT